MDPFSALGVAANVLQIIGLGEKIVSRVIEFRKSATGGLAINAELEDFASSMLDVSGQLKQDAVLYMQSRADSRHSAPVTKIVDHSESSKQDINSFGEEEKLLRLRFQNMNLPSEEESRLGQGFSRLKKKESRSQDRLLGLTSRCQGIAQELIDELAKLRIGDNNKRLDSIKQAIKSVWNESRISSYSKQLAELRSQMCMFMLQELSTVSNEIADLKDSILELSNLQQNPITINSVQTLRLSSMLEDLRNETIRLSKEKQIIESLSFSSILDRHEQISQATESTFEWMFQKSDKSPTEFVKWMTSDKPLFWMTGKAGSGKSTLMKFLVHDERVLNSLVEAAGPSKICVSSFYFWNAGTSLQKSQEGLFRSLLYHIFKQLPHVIPTIVPEFWALNETPIWTYTELTAVFAKLINLKLTDVKFCFFIDGVDEYFGDHERLVDTINNMLAANIKLCISSRPWNIFEAAWGSASKVILHEHTKGDIQKFIEKEFSGFQSLNGIKFSAVSQSRKFQLPNLGNRYQVLIDEIIERANGVFLWVFLVVRSFRRGFINGDTIADFQRRLRIIPTEMEAFLRQILEKTDKAYLSQASRLYQMCLVALLPVSLSTLAFFGDLDDDEDYVYDLPVMEADKDYLVAKCVEAQRRVSARCQDLLEFVMVRENEAVGNLKVVFLHRTVRDFLATPDVDKLLRDWSGEFDAHDGLSKLLLFSLKITPKKFTLAIEELVTELFYQVRLQDVRGGELPRRLMEEIELLAKKSNCFSNSHHEDRNHREFVRFAIEKGLCFYIRDYASDTKFLIETNGGTGLDPPLLETLFDRSSSRSDLKTIEERNNFCTRQIHKETVRALLEIGANPNQIIPQKKSDKYIMEASILEVFYSAIADSPRIASKGIKACWAQVMELLIIYGGNVENMEFKDSMFTAKGAARLRELQRQSNNYQFGHKTQANSKTILQWELLVYGAIK